MPDDDAILIDLDEAPILVDLDEDPIDVDLDGAPIELDLDIGAQGPPGLSGVSLVYTPPGPQSVWTIAHGLNRHPSVTVVDTANDLMLVDVIYLDLNTVQITFGAPSSGSAYLN